MPANDSRVSAPRCAEDESRRAAITVTLAVTDEQLDALAELVAARLSPAPRDLSPWLDTAGAADYLAAKPARIHDLVALGKLTTRRDGRRLLFARAELDAYLEARV